ncbi:hypothetical protein AXY46_03230 [Achromobacter xylosoxidans]|nr:hypothetical protein AXY46_03230 [Achromobacter xylosoxidans]
MASRSRSSSVRLRGTWLTNSSILGHLRFHDLRHSAASEMINVNKVDLYTTGAVLGHKSAAST